MKSISKRKIFITSALIITVLIIVVGIALITGMSGINNKPIKKGLTASLIIDGNPDSLKKGDIISVTVPKATSAVKELQYVEVISAEKATLDDIYYEERESIGYGKKIVNPTKVTFAVCEQQRKAFYGLYLNSVKFGLVCRNNDREKQQLLQKQDAILRSCPGFSEAQSSKPVASKTNNSDKYKTTAFEERNQSSARYNSSAYIEVGKKE